MNQLQEQCVLAAGEPMHRFGIRWIVFRAVWQADLTRGEKGADTFFSWFSVHVLVVIGDRVKGPQLVPGSLRTLLQERVEGLLPCPRVDLGGLGQDAIEIE